MSIFGDYENLKVEINNHSMKLERKLLKEKKLRIKTVAFVKEFFNGYWKFSILNFKNLILKH